MEKHEGQYREEISELSRRFVSVVGAGVGLPDKVADKVADKVTIRVWVPGSRSASHVTMR